MRFICLFVCSLFLAAITAAQNGWQQVQPPPSGYVVDDAHILRPDTIRQLNWICTGTQSAKGVPIVVVTITSLQSIGAYGSIESYATGLFNYWQLGTRQNNRAALLVVSRDDRRARIALGDDWGSGANSASQTIMDDTIIPRFKQGDYDGGIVQGVQQLDQMIRSGKVPFSFKNIIPWIVFGLVAVVVLVIWIRAPLFGRGGLYSSSYDGYGTSSSSWGSSGGGGGGFSSGGGASGSW